MAAKKALDRLSSLLDKACGVVIVAMLGAMVLITCLLYTSDAADD